MCRSGYGHFETNDQSLAYLSVLHIDFLEII